MLICYYEPYTCLRRQTDMRYAYLALLTLMSLPATCCRYSARYDFHADAYYIDAFSFLFFAAIVTFLQHYFIHYAHSIECWH